MKNQTIKISGDRVFLNGQSDIPSSLQNILTASEDFKIVSHKNGTVEFEKVGEANELKFSVPELANTTINFDSHVVKVSLEDDKKTFEYTTSGQSYGTAGFGGTTYQATVTLENGYEIDTVTSTDSDYNLLTFSGNIISFRTNSSGCGNGFTITTKVTATKQSIEVSTLSGWANLSSGNHSITVKTRASGYADSASSNAVTVNKAASGYNVTLVYQQHDAPSDADSRSIHYPTVTYSANGETAKHTLTSAGATLQNCNSLSYEAPIVDPGSSYDSGFDITLSDVVVTVNGVTATGYQINITQDTTIIFNVYPCYAVVSDDIPCIPKCCFVAGTKVKTPNGEQAIETLKTDDYITTYNEEAKQYEPNKVLRKLINRNVTELATLKLSNGETLQFNAYHPLLTENGYKSLTCHNDLPLLTKEDKLVGGIAIKEITIENLEEPIAAYNLLVENNNNFIVNGVIALGKED